MIECTTFKLSMIQALSNQWERYTQDRNYQKETGSNYYYWYYNGINDNATPNIVTPPLRQIKFQPDHSYY